MHQLPTKRKKNSYENNVSPEDLPGNLKKKRKNLEDSPKECGKPKLPGSVDFVDITSMSPSPEKSKENDTEKRGHFPNYWQQKATFDNMAELDGINQVFLHEPYRASNSTLYLKEDSVENLKDDFWLTTDLIDYLIKHGINSSSQSDIIIPTTAVENLMKSLLLKADRNEQFLKDKRSTYHHYSAKEHKIVMSTCTSGHFFVISLTIDGSEGNKDRVFKNVKIFDSFKRVSHPTIVTRNKNGSPATDLLKIFQEFLYKFVLFDTKWANELKENVEYIIEGVEYFPCPQQKNMSDCSLFSLGVLYHVINGIAVDANIFSQSTIDNFRQGLYKVLSAPPQKGIEDPKMFLSRCFIMSFFPKLAFTTKKMIRLSIIT